MALKSYRPHQPFLERNIVKKPPLFSKGFYLFSQKKRYKYESRHLHAAKRPRDSNGKFLKSPLKKAKKPYLFK